MKIGYACQCLSNTIPSFRTCTKKFASEENLISIISHNLKVLDQILEYNHDHYIEIFRLSSNLIPFGSSSVNNITWRSIFADEFKTLGDKAKAYGIRLTMHPGQYTILNTPNFEIWDRSVMDLRYHCDILNLMGMDRCSKIILHIGGIYGNKSEAIQRFLTSYPKLDKDIQERLVIENDDRYYNLEDVYHISQKLNIPIIFDHLHHELLPSFSALSLWEVAKLVQKSWHPKDGRMKIHYSQQAPLRRMGAHATFLDGSALLSFCQEIHFMDLDIMLEIKSKNLAALQAVDLLYPKQFQPLKVWRRYRYLVLSHSLPIFTMLEQEASHMDPKTFYQRIYQALSMPNENGVMCYRFILMEWKNYLGESDIQKLERVMLRFQEHKLSQQGINHAFLAVLEKVRHQEDYLFLCGISE